MRLLGFGVPWLYCGRRYPSCLAVRVVAFFTYDRRVKEGRLSNERRWGVWCPARHGAIIGGGRFA